MKGLNKKIKYLQRIQNGAAKGRRHENKELWDKCAFAIWHLRELKAEIENEVKFCEDNHPNFSDFDSGVVGGLMLTLLGDDPSREELEEQIGKEGMTEVDKFIEKLFERPEVTDKIDRPTVTPGDHNHPLNSVKDGGESCG